MPNNIDTGGQSPEWGDAKAIQGGFGLGRSLLYELEAAGLIDSVSLKRPGQSKGKRLFNIPSIRAYLNGLRKKTASPVVGK